MNLHGNGLLELAILLNAVHEVSAINEFHNQIYSILQVRSDLIVLSGRDEPNALVEERSSKMKSIIEQTERHQHREGERAHERVERGMELNDERRARRARVRVVQREHAELRERALEVVLLEDHLLAQHLHGHHLRTAVVARLGARLGQHHLRAARGQRHQPSGKCRSSRNTRIRVHS